MRAPGAIPTLPMVLLPAGNAPTIPTAPMVFSPAGSEPVIVTPSPELGAIGAPSDDTGAVSMTG